MENEIIIRYLQSKIPDLKAIYGFGSRFNARAIAESDWDLAFLAEKPIDYQTLWESAYELGELLQTKKVDLIDLRKAPIVFRFEIVSTAQRFYCEDDFFCDKYECAVYTEYQFFNEQTEDLVEAWVKNYLQKN